VVATIAAVSDHKVEKSNSYGLLNLNNSEESQTPTGPIASYLI